MKKQYLSAFLLILLIGLVSCKQNNQTPYAVKVAFMADVHFSDIYGELSDSDYKGVLNPGNNRYVFARTMQAQLNSTRIFNENYFAFLAALDDVVKRGIKYVVLPGDFSDDGQPINVRGLKQILSTYEQKFGIRFFLTTGNHDPVRPYSMDSGKMDFLGENGIRQPVMSKAGLFNTESEHFLPVIISDDIKNLGYEELLYYLKDFGFNPRAEDLYWETPFSDYAYMDYSYELAEKSATISKRQYKIESSQLLLPDVSYLVEPEEGIWFLAIDANIYHLKKQIDDVANNPLNYNNASSGYNTLLTHKKHLINWVKSVTLKAKKLHKKLVVFSHYPMIDFNDDATSHIKTLVGEGNMQLHRVPNETVAKLFADAGVKVHFGGHMHINDTGFRQFQNGKSLVNVQVPSLAAYIPAYKIAEFNSESIEVETVLIDYVPRFKEIFPLYEMEYAYLNSINSTDIWNKEILKTDSYLEFTNWHLKELVRLRLLKNDWPLEFKTYLLKSSGEQLAHFAGIINIDPDFHTWTGLDMILDFYRLRNADELAYKNIESKRIEQYELLIDHLLKNSLDTIHQNSLENDLKEFASIFHHFLNGEPADHFSVDLDKGIITKLE